MVRMCNHQIVPNRCRDRPCNWLEYYRNDCLEYWKALLMSSRGTSIRRWTFLKMFINRSVWKPFHSKFWKSVSVVEVWFWMMILIADSTRAYLTYWNLNIFKNIFGEKAYIYILILTSLLLGIQSPMRQQWVMQRVGPELATSCYPN